MQDSKDQQKKMQSANSRHQNFLSYLKAVEKLKSIVPTTCEDKRAMMQSYMLNDNFVIINKKFACSELTKVIPFVNSTVPLIRLDIRNIKSTEILNSLIAIISTSVTLRELIVTDYEGIDQDTLKNLLKAVSSSCLISFNYSDSIFNRVAEDSIMESITEFIKENKNLFSFIFSSSSFMDLQRLEKIKSALSANKTLGSIEFRFDMRTSEITTENTEFLINLLKANESIVNLCFNKSNLDRIWIGSYYHSSIGSTALSFSNSSTTLDYNSINIRGLHPIVGQIESNWRNFQLNCDEIHQYIAKKKVMKNEDIDKKTGEELLSISYNLKKIYILSQQLKYIINAPEIISNRSKYTYYCSIGSELESYRSRYPLRICGISKDYHPKDEKELFLSYEMIVPVFQFTYTAHINFRKENEVTSSSNNQQMQEGR